MRVNLDGKHQGYWTLSDDFNLSPRGVQDDVLSHRSAKGRGLKLNIKKMMDKS